MSAEQLKTLAAAPSRRNRLIIVALVFVLALTLDLVTKAWAWNNLKGNPPIEVIEHVFYLRFGFNTGAAFSLFSDESWGRVFFVTVTFFALGYMGWLALKMPTTRAYGFVAIGLIGAGAAGNLHDRFRRVMEVYTESGRAERHGVVDFLQFYYNWPEDYWPIFNVADSSLVCGVGILLVFLHFHGAEPEQAGDASDAAQSDPGESGPDESGPDESGPDESESEAEPAAQHEQDEQAAASEADDADEPADDASADGDASQPAAPTSA